MREIRRRFGIIGALLSLVAALLASGCSTLTAARLAYNQAPELAYWTLDAYADFNGAQSLQAKAVLARWQDWHRYTQLPLYAATLRALQAQLPQDISADQACSVVADARQTVMVSLHHVEPAAASLAATLQPAQLEAMARKFAKSNAEWRGTYLTVSPQKAQAKRLEQATDRSEWLYGALNSAQNEVLKRSVSQSVFDAALSDAERLRRQDDTLQTLRGVMANNATATVNATAAVHALVARSFTSPNTAHRRYQDALTREGCVLFAELHQRASAAQRNHAAQKLQRYESLLLSLAEPS